MARLKLASRLLGGQLGSFHLDKVVGLDGGSLRLLAQTLPTGLGAGRLSGIQRYGPNAFLQIAKLRPGRNRFPICIPLRIQTVEFRAIAGKIRQVQRTGVGILHKGAVQRISLTGKGSFPTRSVGYTPSVAP